MPRDTRRRFEAEINKMRPKLRRAFLQAIQDIKDTAKIDQIIASIERGNITEALESLKLGPEFFGPLQDAIAEAHSEGGEYQVQSLPKINPATGEALVVRYHGRHERAEDWIRERSSNLITGISDGLRDTLRDELVRGLADGRNPKSTALDLVGRVNPSTKRRSGGLIGLTSREVGYIANYRDKLIEQGREQAQIDRMVTKYSNKMLRLRGERIARTETIAAMNAGKLEAMNQAIDNGEISADVVTRVWDATGDARTRISHAIMDGQSVPLGRPFESPNGASLMHPGDSSLGAGPEETVHCRCYMQVKVDFLAGVS